MSNFFKPWTKPTSSYQARVMGEITSTYHTKLSKEYLQQLPYGERGIEHLRTGYPDLFSEWSEMEEESESHEKERQEFLEEIKKFVIEPLRIPDAYSVSPPRLRYAYGDRLAGRILLVQQEESGGNLEIQPVSTKEGETYELRWEGAVVVASTDENEVRKAMSLVEGALKLPKFKIKAKELRQTFESLSHKREELTRRLHKEIIESWIWEES